MKVGVFALIAFFIVYSVIFWMFMYTTTEISNTMQGSYFVGSLSIMCMAFALILSVRPRVVEGYFGGLDKMYQVHKYLGIFAMLLFLGHFATADDGQGGDEEEATAETTETSADAASTSTTASSIDTVATTSTSTPTTSNLTSSETAVSTPVDSTSPVANAAPTESTGLMARLEELIVTLGLVALIGFILLIVLTLNRKIPYHRWMPTHRFMGVLYIIVSAHAMISMFRPVEMSITSPPGMIIGVLITAGILSYLYKELVYPFTQQHQYSLVEVNQLNRASELVFESKSKRFDFKPGQFMFVRIKQDGFDEAHPFTISSGTNDSRLRVTMKTLGDYTRRVRSKLHKGANVSIEGPYGRFDPLAGGSKHVWVAGGIGITPFLSTLRSLKSDNKKEVHLFYCVREVSEALFLEEMQKIADENSGIHIHLFDSSTGIFLTAKAVVDAISSPLSEWNFSLCGPKPLTNAITDGLTNLGVSSSKMHFEVFEMR